MTITGVIGINDKRVQWLVEDIFNNGINIDYLTHIQERREELEAEGVDEDEIESMIENEEYEGGTCVLGYILDPESGLYEEDPESEICVIQREYVLQITRSTHTTECRECSPCYPNQGDLGSPVEHGFDTYAPRPEDGEEE
jgi:hypothetical protein